MTLEELHSTVVDGFKRVDERLDAHDARFDQIDDRFNQIDGRFAQVEERLAAHDGSFARIDGRLTAHESTFARIDNQFDELRREMRENFAAIEAKADAREERTRRYFEIMVERIESAVRIVAEGHGHQQTVLDDHEVRIQAVETRLPRSSG